MLYVRNVCISQNRAAMCILQGFLSFLKTSILSLGIVVTAFKFSCFSLKFCVCVGVLLCVYMKYGAWGTEVNKKGIRNMRIVNNAIWDNKDPKLLVGILYQHCYLQKESYLLRNQGLAFFSSVVSFCKVAQNGSA